MAEKKTRKTIEQEPSLEAQERLIEIMNDSPRVKSFDGTLWELRALKPGTQWLIAQEAISIQKEESANFGDVVKQFAVNVPSVVKVITLGILNDRKRIFANGHDGEFSEEYRATYETIMWNTSQSSWIALLVEMLQMLDIEVFFSTTSSIQILRQRLLGRKTTMEEQKALSPAQSGGK
jgi:hypothetical protein